MPKTKQAAVEDLDRVEVEAVAQFRHNGEYIQRGQRVIMSHIEAEELVALNFARRTMRRLYKDRAMRAATR